MQKQTTMIKPSEINRKWYVIDATDVTLGRLASKVAHMLRGKHKATYTPHIDCGDYIIIVNANKVKLTGNKLDDKMYDANSEYYEDIYVGALVGYQEGYRVYNCCWNFANLITIIGSIQ